MIILDYVLVPALLYLVAGVAMNSLVPGVPVWLWLIAFVLLNTVVNYLGIEMTAKVNKVMLVAELLVLAVFLVVGVVALVQGRGRGFSWTPLYDAGTFSWPVVFGAVSVAVLSFLGFDGISMLAEENRESVRGSPTRWSPRRPPPGCSTRWRGTGSCPRSWYCTCRWWCTSWCGATAGTGGGTWCPVLGFAILLYVVINAKVAAQVLGFAWLGLGVLVLIGYTVAGRRPELAGQVDEDPERART